MREGPVIHSRRPDHAIFRRDHAHTGASSGIGAATGPLAATEGAAVVLGVHRAARLEALAGEIGQAGVSGMGGTLTEMAGDDPAFLDLASGLHAMKRLAAPEEVARAALFLLSEEESFITGTAPFADGAHAVSKV